MGTRPQNSQYTYLTVTVYGNLIATKKFPIKTLLKMIDSNVKNLGEIKYDNQNSLQHHQPSIEINWYSKSTSMTMF